MLKGRIHSTESFGSVDGPGVRFIIFMQGCNMRCKYCHNPDTWNINGGEEKTADELIATALRYKSYWGKNGGITISGGEPLLQIDFLLELCKMAKEKDINICVDTAGEPFTYEETFFNKFNELCKYVDLFLVDIKHIDASEHIKLTGRNNNNIIEMFKYLSEINKPIWIRHVLVPKITDNDESLYKTKEFIDTLKNVKRVEVLPYHTLGVFKWEELGIKYSLNDINPPNKERILNAQKILGCNF